MSKAVAVTIQTVGIMIGGLTAAATGYNVADGGRKIIDYLAQVDSVRGAIYLRATEITPELIQHASDITDMISRGDLHRGIAQLVVGGFTAGIAYFTLRTCSNFQKYIFEIKTPKKPEEGK